MAENSSEQEPSIEEILASIRQIISDDEDESDTVEAAEVVEDPVRHKNNDVMDLTEDDLVELEDEIEEEEEFLAEPDPVEVDLEEEIEDEVDMITPPAPEPPPAPAREPVRESVPSDILSSNTQASALSSLSKLTKKMPINNSRDYDGVTLEDIVRELLHPMLREWMDDNLPHMVERIVQKELDKLARRALDD